MRKNDFTLAEVLITLGIIGVVAAMTMPSLVVKHQEKVAVTALKKFYTSISQAYSYAKYEHGTPDNWYSNMSGVSQNEKNMVMTDIFAQYMKIDKICYANKGCFPDVMYKKIDGNNTVNWDAKTNGLVSKLRTSDGMSVFFYSYGSTPTSTGTGFLQESFGALSVDINGYKLPNVQGRDMFSFTITKEGIVPLGTATAMTGQEFKKVCNRINCQGYCEGCTAWVLYNENMDYLHCDDLDWNGKTSCK